jgi:hypothetical protein
VFLDSAIKQEKGVKGIHTEKEEKKNFLCTIDSVLYLENLTKN